LPSLEEGNESASGSIAVIGVRKGERFKTLVREAGLVNYWLAHDWSDLCRPVGLTISPAIDTKDVCYRSSAVYD
jgi:hypothetical protein